MNSGGAEGRREVNDSSHSTSTGLLARVKANDPQAWQRLSDLYGPLVYHWCRKAGVQAQDAADIVQEVFRSVAGGISGFQKRSGSRTFRGWLRTITQNKVYDHARAAHNNPQPAGGTDAYTRLANMPEQRNDSEESTGADASASILLRRVLETLQGEFEERTWQAFWAAISTGRSAAEIGTELGMTANAVRLAKGRVLRRLREEIGDPPLGEIG